MMYEKTAEERIASEFPTLARNEISIAIKRQAEYEVARAKRDGVRVGRGEAVANAYERVSNWLRVGHVVGVDHTNLDSLIPFIISHPATQVWAVLRSKQMKAGRQ
jgi:hypothetical protein